MVERPYAPAAVIGATFLALAMILVVPATEWLAVYVYLAAVAGMALLLYRRGIKPVSPTFAGSLFAVALIAKLLSSLARYWTVVDLYDMAADAPAYHAEGILLAPYFRDFDFSILEWYVFRGEGSTRMAILTGVLYSLMPASMAGSFLFFGGLAFAGSVLFYRSVRMASPDKSAAAYTVFIFFLPSILFWPSSLGKDAWVFFCSGLVAWGWASFVRRRNLSGLLVVAGALLLINLVRPHIAAFMGVSLGAAYMLYATRVVRSLALWVVGAAVIAGLGFYLVQSGAQFLKLEELSLGSVEEFYEEQQDRTAIGGSRYSTVSVFTPASAW